MLGRRLVAMGILAALGAGIAGCVIETQPAYYDTQIEFGEVRNLGYYCGGPLTSWTVYNPETETAGTAGCEQPVLFTNLAPNTTYSFQIDGYSGDQLCWQGTCQVFARSGTRTYADCSRYITHYCGF